MATDYVQWFHDAVRALGRGQPEPYYLRSIIRYVRTLELVSAYVTFNAGTTVAEVGVGMLSPMLRVGAGCAVTAYGLAADAIWKHLTTLGIDSVEWDLHSKLPESALRQSHSVVFFSEVIEHLCRFPVEVLADIRDLVKPGGYLIVTTVNFLRLSNRLRILRGQSPLIDPFRRSLDGRYHIREFTLPELAGYIQEAGFEVLEARYWGIHEHPLAGKLVQPLEWLVPTLRNYIAFVARRPMNDLG
jgi:2-polyprenyl-3-methyl-5-hydroxy-6-metoxy-1,4-benzoquinol methylase